MSRGSCPGGNCPPEGGRGISCPDTVLYMYVQPSTHRQWLDYTFNVRDSPNVWMIRKIFFFFNINYETDLHLFLFCFQVKMSYIAGMQTQNKRFIML